MSIDHTITPAHFIVATGGSAGDLYPFLSLAGTLCERGHQVTFAAQENARPLAEQAGLAFLPTMNDAQYERVVNDPDLWTVQRGFEVLWRSAAAHGLHRLRDHLATLPGGRSTIILAHPLVMAAAALARAGNDDIRLVAAYLAPSNLRTCGDPLTIGPLRVPRWVPRAWRRAMWRMVDARVIDRVALADMNARRGALGLAPITHVMDHLYGAADYSLTLFPSWFSPIQPDWPHPLHSGDFPLYEPAPRQVLPEEVERFLAAGAAPVVFTSGTAQRHAAAYFEDALRAARQLDRRAIVLTRHRQQVPDDLPATVLWQPYCAFQPLLPRVAALVHHGGIGTTAEALRAGVPQLVTPFAHDQFDNAERVRALGVGAALAARRVNADRLAAALRKLLASREISSQCAAHKARCASNQGPAAICAAMESHLGLHAPV